MLIVVDILNILYIVNIVNIANIGNIGNVGNSVIIVIIVPAVVTKNHVFVGSMRIIFHKLVWFRPTSTCWLGVPSST